MTLHINMNKVYILYAISVVSRAPRTLFKDMRLAVLIYGQYRQFDIAYTSWGFLNELDCDVYVSSWDKSVEILESMGINVSLNVTEEMFTRFIPKAKVEILNESDYPLTENNLFLPRMHIHWRNLCRMLKESQQRYDTVILLRTDLFLTICFPSTELYTLNEPNTLYGFSEIEMVDNDLFCNDVFFCGNQDIMMSFMDTLPNDCDYHTKLAKHIQDSGIHLKVPYGTDYFRYAFVRPNCRAIPTVDLNEFIIFSLWEIYNRYNEKRNDDCVNYNINISSI